MQHIRQDSPESRHRHHHRHLPEGSQPCASPSPLMAAACLASGTSLTSQACQPALSAVWYGSSQALLAASWRSAVLQHWQAPGQRRQGAPEVWAAISCHAVCFCSTLSLNRPLLSGHHVVGSGQIGRSGVGAHSRTPTTLYGDAWHVQYTLLSVTATSFSFFPAKDSLYG